MKLRVTVGDVDIRAEGLDMTRRQLVALMREAGSIALALAEASATGDDQSDIRPGPFGFSAHLDLDPERNLTEDSSEWFEESP